MQLSVCVAAELCLCIFTYIRYAQALSQLGNQAASACSVLAMAV